MKKYKLATLVLVSIFLMINTSTCKRNNAGDPDNIGPTGHSITLSGSANPDTVTMPTPNYTLITIKATRYDPDAPEPYAPANNEKIVLQPGAYGRFDGYNVNNTVSKYTNSSGIVTWKYIIPPTYTPRISTTDYIRAILVNEQDPNDTSISLLVPVNIVPFQEKNYIIISGTIIDQFSNKKVKNVVVELSTGAVYKTGSTGVYTFTIYGGATLGWYGDITPTKEGATFIPATIALGSEDAPIYSDYTGQNFYAVVKQEIQSSRTEIEVVAGSGGGYVTEMLYIYCSPDATFRATFIASSSVGWIEVGLTNTGPWSGSLTSTSPRNIHIKIDDNITGAVRTGDVVITAISPENAVSSVTISIKQEL
ncbi:MAG: hypothetical protein KAT34_07585 [Candidatus Aminicenantes bacterium]|nr:hypothetical protein [Candidatus Aminicenantes bacterium]